MRKKEKENLTSLFSKKKTVMCSATTEPSLSSQVTSLAYRLSGFRIPQQSWDARLVEELTTAVGAEEGEESTSTSTSTSSLAGPPTHADLFLPKTSCNVFLSTPLDFHLRCLGIRQLLIAGVVTDQCVAAAVMTAGDLGYFVTVVEDATAATSEGRHGAALRTLRGFARVRSTAEVVAELEEAAARSREAMA